ncbi:MAG: glycosyltransferase family 4 protein [Alteromonadaceae bacterium]|nr:glycosyltransferase family 4 protein [Alteromonadaceae bacterium]
MKTIKILMVVPLATEAKGGGIGRLVGYFRRAANGVPQLDIDVFPTRASRSAPMSYVSTVYRALLFPLFLLLRKTDIVHLHVAPNGSTKRKAFFAWVSRLFGKPTILHLHGSGYDSYFARQSNVTKDRIRKFFHSAQGVVVLGEGWRDWAISNAGLRLSSQNVHVIDNGVPDTNFRSTHDNKVPNIIFVGLVGRRKGVDTLLDALSMLSQTDDWKCTICGNGEVEYYKSIANSNGLNPSRVTFTGWQSEEQIRSQMADSDIFVLPSRAENQPIAILEAMAVGLPVVATSVGDIPNQVVDGQTGWIVPPDDPDALCKSLSDLVENANRRRDMGKSGRERFELVYSSQRNLEKTIKLYSKILNNSE